ncbi:MAG: GNAT family N-acetyltransferase [Pseudonocardiales bacterium]|nr:MAG: GNAT family N-acetyltransferase [Pseudonocardiales bacterium]
MLRPDLPITTERLLLRPITPEDLDAIHAYRSRADVCRYLYEPPSSRDEVREWIGKRLDRTRIRVEGDVLGLGVVVAATQQLVGDVMLHWVSQAHAQGEIGYIIHPDHAGRGYATEVAAALLPLGFDTDGGLGLHRIFGRLDARNTASARVLERLGMRREAHLVQNEFVKGEWCDEAIYALLADEWFAQLAGNLE